jgi:hypothetical protein
MSVSKCSEVWFLLIIALCATTLDMPAIATSLPRCRLLQEQTDVHLPETTVHEALVFSGQLRLPSTTPPQTMHTFVEEVILASRFRVHACERLGIGSSACHAPATLARVTRTASRP